jgi:hypothetical protein
VNVNIHCRPASLGATTAVYVPSQLTETGLPPGQKAGVDESEHDDAFVDEKVRSTEPPVDATELEPIERFAAGGSGAETVVGDRPAGCFDASAAA